MIGGTLQWTRENFSNSAESNIRGEARRISLLAESLEVVCAACGHTNNDTSQPRWVTRASAVRADRAARIQSPASPSSGIASTTWLSDDGQERPALGLAAVERHELDVGQRHEGTL